MQIENYAVTCLKCKKTSRLAIVNGTHIQYKDHLPIISSRLRGDMQWGFECACGNDSRVALQERKDIPMLVQNGGKEAIEQITESLKKSDKSKFRLERI